jgi:ferredoxin--NADP+ reductase
METIENLVADVDNLVDPAHAEQDAVLEVLAGRGVEYTTWQGWLALNQHELALGAADASHVERERVKVVDRDEQVAISRAI